MYSVYLIIVLGMLSAFGPFVIDMYLPAMPEMTKVFSASVSSVQLGLTFCMVGLAFGQVIFGPLSDKYGRKPVLYFSLLLYIVSTLFCCLSQNIDTFNIARLLQGLGGAGAIVYSRSAPTDLYSGKELAKIIAIVGAVNGIAPVAAPVIGGSVANLIGWRGIFYILLGIGVVITAMVIPVKETLPKDAREQGSFLRSFEGFILVCKVPNFAAFTTVFGLSMGALFAYISSTPFILQNEFGLSQFHFSLLFALNAIAIGAGALLAVRFSTTAKATYFGTAGSLIAAVFACNRNNKNRNNEDEPIEAKAGLYAESAEQPKSERTDVFQQKQKRRKNKCSVQCLPSQHPCALDCGLKERTAVHGVGHVLHGNQKDYRCG